MLLSPYYDEIKAGALDILHNRLSTVHSNTTLGELCQYGNEWSLRNTVGVALCRARDDVLRQVWEEAHRRGHFKRGRNFSKGNFTKAEGEIVKQIRAERR